MDGIKMKGKKGLITKTWERCKSSSKAIGSLTLTKRSKSRPCLDADGALEEEKRAKKMGRVAPQGCFCVYVGPQKQRFVIKTEYANHPLFKMLLEEAELEYGYNSQGPLALPCNVDTFDKVLMEMDQSTDSDPEAHIRQGCAFGKRYGSYHLLSPSRMVNI